VLAVRDRGELVGVVPLYVSRARGGLVEYRLMAADFGACVEPLALPGREWQVAAELASVLASCTPRPDVVALGPMSVASQWPLALGSCWPGPAPALVRRHDVQGAPIILLDERSSEGWLASLSSKMRNNLRRSERQLTQAGGTSRCSTAATLRADAEAFARLHVARWRGRGWPRLVDLGERLPDWIEDLGRDLIDQGRFGMSVLELEGTPICVDFHLIAGEELCAINMGWDERHARLAPPRIAALRMIESAARLGCRRLNLGRGEQENKRCLANGTDAVANTLVMPASRRLPLAYLRSLPVLARQQGRELAGRLFPERFPKRCAGGLHPGA